MSSSSAARARTLAEVKARRRAAGKKLSRLRKQGVNTQKIDNRLSNAELDTLSTRQLQSHLRSLNQFTARSNSIVAGHRGTPLNGNLARQLKRAETKYNTRSAAFYESVKELTLPGQTSTVAEYLSRLRTGDIDRRPRRDGDYKTFGVMNRTIGNITNNDSLKKLLQQMQRKSATDYLAKEAKEQRRIINKMLARSNNKQLIPIIKDMTDEDVITLQYTEFMPKLEGLYAMSNSTSTDKPSWQSAVIEGSEHIVEQLVQWAHDLHSNTDQTTPEQDNPDDTRATTPTKSRRTPARDKRGRFVRRDHNTLFE